MSAPGHGELHNFTDHFMPENGHYILFCDSANLQFWRLYLSSKCGSTRKNMFAAKRDSHGCRQFRFFALLAF